MRAKDVTTTTTNRRKHAQGVERVRDAGDERADDHQEHARDHGLDRARDVEAGDQLELGDGGDQVALVQAARLVVDEDDAAADHHHHEDRHHHRARQQVLHVGHVGVDLDHVEARVGAPPAARASPRASRTRAGRSRVPARATETKLSVLSSIRATRGSFFAEHAPREVGRDGEHAVHAAVAEVGQGLAGVGVDDGVDGVRAGGDRRGQLAHAHRGDAVVLVHDRRASGA